MWKRAERRGGELDEREQAIEEAERLEGTGIEADAKIARGIRQAIINTDFKQHEAEQQHLAVAEQADQTRKAKAEAEAQRKSEAEAERKAHDEAEEKKAG